MGVAPGAPVYPAIGFAPGVAPWPPMGLAPGVELVASIIGSVPLIGVAPWPPAAAIGSDPIGVAPGMGLIPGAVMADGAIPGIMGAPVAVAAVASVEAGVGVELPPPPHPASPKVSNVAASATEDRETKRAVAT